MIDNVLKKLVSEEKKRQESVIDLIASENCVSKNVRDYLSSRLINKYAEGYPGARYYCGNAVVDKIERLAQSRALKVFNLSGDIWRVNVQPYSGTPANLAIYLALAKRGEKIMGLGLSMGGHLSHGYKVSATGILWQGITYALNKDTELLDYDEISRVAMRERPRVIVAGYTAYPRIVDFQKFSGIARASGAVFVADISHTAGLVAAGVHLSPFPYADIVMTTTHKTLRGPRSAMIFSRHEFAKLIDRAVFPGLQGGPHMNQIAAVAAALNEAGKKSFSGYAMQVVRNARKLSAELKNLGWRMVAGGTDTHLLLVDVWKKGISGEEAAVKLEKAGIIANKNTIPFDERSPVDPSGIRLGTPAVTTRGMKEPQMKKIAFWIDAILTDKEKVGFVRKAVAKFMKKYPLP